MDASMHDGEGNRKATLRKSQVKVIEYIESTLNNIINEIHIRPCGRPSIVLKHITDLKPQGIDDGWAVNEKKMKISFPGKTRDEAWRFTCVGKILSEIYSALMEGEVITKRDIYYHDPELFRSQKLVDRYVDMVAYTCGVTRLDLNVTASPKGLVAGLHENDKAYGLVPDRSIQEPQQLFESVLYMTDCKWILVVEKEATFKSLVESQFWQGNEDIGRGLLVTGKGYPDLATQRFIRTYSDQQRFQPPTMQVCQPFVLGLFDCDPDGIKISDVYQNGSKSLAHERAYHVPEMKRLGLNPSDVFANGQDDSAALPLTARDVSKIKSMLIADVECPLGTGFGAESRLALQWMRMLNRKAEIQILEDMPGGMERWLIRRIEQELVQCS